MTSKCSYITGIEFLKTLENCPATIITSSYSEYAIDGYRFNVVDYLLKPFSPLRFLQAVDKAREHISMRRNNSLVKPGDADQIVEELCIYIKSKTQMLTTHLL